MLAAKKTDLGKQTYQFDVTIPQKTVESEHSSSFNTLSKELTVEGFRKGTAPKNIADKHINKEAVYRNLIDKLVPKIYEELIAQEKLKPIVMPKVELVSAKENEDWTLRITIAEKPEVKLENYKEVITNLKGEQKKDAIWVPGKDAKESDNKENEAKRNELLNKILEALLKKADVAVSDLIIEAEVEKKLAQLVDDVRKIGLTMDGYLKSKGETMQSIRAKFSAEITDMYKLELLLEEIAESEKIVVNKTDLESIFSKITDEKAKKDAEKNAYFYASIVRRQKTLDYLMNL